MLLFLIFSFIGIPNLAVHSTDDFAIIDGQSFVYDVITSKIDVSVSRNDFSVDTFHIAGHQFSTEKSVEITITDVELENLNYSISCEDITYNFSLYIFDQFRPDASLFFYRFSTDSLYISYAFQDSLSRHGTLTLSTYSRGFPLNYNILFFIPPKESTWEYLQEISQLQQTDPLNPLFHIPSISPYTNLILNSSYQEQNGFAILDNYIQVSFEGTFSKGIINSGCKYVYNMTNGVLYGFRSIGYFDGKINGDKVHCESEFLIELSGFNLADLSFYSDIEYIDSVRIALIFVGVFSSLFIVPIIIISIRKRRNI
jgi:hypothetical protein